MEISSYTLAVVGALTVAGCLALGIGLALNQRGLSRQRSGHAPGGRLLRAPSSAGLWGKFDGRVGTPSNPSRADVPDVEAHSRSRPLTADQQATRAAWARWRAEQAAKAQADGE